METFKKIIGLDLRSLALFRVMIGGIVILDVFYRMQDLTAHYTDRGVLPRDVLLDKFWHSYHFSVHLLSGLWGYQLALFLLTVATAFCVMIGYRTKFMVIVTWILLVSMQNRNYMILNGGDVLLRCLYFWAMFLPLNYRYSVDSALATNKPYADTNRFVEMGSLALILQVAFLYWFTALMKTGEEWLWDGTATYFALQIDQFTTPVGKILQAAPIWFSKYLTIPVWIWELLGPFLFFSPIFFKQCRYLAIIGFSVMHFGFGSMMYIGLFPFIDFASLLVMLPASFWDGLHQKFRSTKRLGLKLYYDQNCGFCRKMCLLLREFWLIPETKIIPAQQDEVINKVFQENNTWVVVDDTGAQHIRFAGLRTALRHSPLWVGITEFLLLPVRALQKVGLRNLCERLGAWWDLTTEKWGDRIYQFIANRRENLGYFSARWLPEMPIHVVRYRSFRSITVNVWAAFLIAFVFYYNLTTLRSLRIFGYEIASRVNFNFDRYLPYLRQNEEGQYVVDGFSIRKIKYLASVLRIDQKWSMFSPFPLKDDGWYYMPGKLGNGKEVDVWNFTETKASKEKPAMVAYTYPNQRWRKYMMNIWKKRYKDHRLYFGKYLCRTWNNDRSGDDRLHKWQMHFVKELSTSMGPKWPFEEFTLWRHECYEEEKESKNLTH